ncbi:MAG: amino acid ABC transporter permease [Defluviitaleaceae bacterium]|nr:amino acid ABC transporter permease [Defluviitaleaceae bacterium]
MLDRTPPGPLTPPYGWEEGLRFEIYQNLIHGDRWRQIASAIIPTLQVTFAGLAIGLALGLILALMRVSKFWFLRWISITYITIIRGIPLMLQLMIWTFVILVNPEIPRLVVGFIAFGINSSAYVAEIFRGGILSVDKGQTEAGRSLGLTAPKNMALVVMPQAFKNSLPALVSEFIMLFKETSLLGVIAVVDITRSVDIIRSRTFSPFVPLFAAALIYLTVVTIATWLLGLLERRLRKSDTR